MRVEQALVAVGGEASRLKAGGVEVVSTKSFMSFAERPLLFWCLSSLRIAGIKRVVLVGNQSAYLEQAKNVVESLPDGFQRVIYFQDEGLGVHGLPYHTRHLLDDEFFFECGHGVSRPAHYRQMDGAKREGTIVFSAFQSHLSNPRQPVILTDNGVKLADPDQETGEALAHPLLIDQEYADRLPSLGFDVKRIIGHYAARSKLSYIWNDMPPEFDVIEELRAVQTVYSDLPDLITNHQDK